MVFKIDYTNKEQLSNFMVNKLLDIVNIKPVKDQYSKVYDLNRAEFGERKAKIEIVPQQSLDIKLAEEELLQLESVNRKENKLIFNFVLDPNYTIEFETNEKFHSFLGFMHSNKSELNLPEEIETNLEYRDMPFGLCHTLPKNILNNLDYFWISSNHQHIKWPYSENMLFEGDKQRLGVWDSSNFFSEEGKKKIGELTKALVKTGFVKHQTENTTQGSKDKLILEKEMDYEMFFRLEDLLAKIKSNETGYNIQSNLKFNGKTKTETLENIPSIFDNYISDDYSWVEFPDFTLRPQQFNNGSVVRIGPGDLETAARISSLFGKDTEISYKKS